MKYFIILFLFCLIFLILIFKFEKTSFPQNHQKIQILIKSNDKEVVEFVKRYNQNIQKIRTLIYKKIIVRFQKSIFLKAKADLFFKKNNNVRIIINGLMSKQMDIGSNEEIFWFWSKHIDPPCYYYSNHNDLGKTCLKTPLNPDWLIESMGLKEISIQDIEFVEINGEKGLKQNKFGTFGEKINVFTLIDLEKDIVLKRYLCDSENNVIASVDYVDYLSIHGINIPNKLEISWFDEEIFMTWDITDIEVNIEIPAETWSMPEEQSINLINVASQGYEE